MYIRFLQITFVKVAGRICYAHIYALIIFGHVTVVNICIHKTHSGNICPGTFAHETFDQVSFVCIRLVPTTFVQVIFRLPNISKGVPKLLFF